MKSFSLLIQDLITNFFGGSPPPVTFKATLEASIQNITILQPSIKANFLEIFYKNHIHEDAK